MSTNQPYFALVATAWAATAAVALFFSAYEGGHVIPLLWSAACIAFPFLWRAPREPLRLAARLVMAGLAVLSVIAAGGVITDGSWDGSDRLVFAVAVMTILATGITVVAILRASPQDVTAVNAGTPNQATAVERPGGAQTARRGQAVAKVFVSYRRDDSQATTDRLFDHLASAFPRENLFRDIDSIPKGRDFREWIRRSVAGCDVLLAIIGPQWLSILDESGRPRLHDPADFVRLEIEAALERDIPVIPVLLSNAQMPRPEDLPESMRALAFRNGAPLRHDPDFIADVGRLIADLRNVIS